MAVELLLKNIDDVHPDPEIDRIAALKRGDVVFVKELPHDGWNDYETLPEFARLIISDAYIGDVGFYTNPWYLELQYEILNYNLAEDIYLIKIFSNTPGIASIGALNPKLVINHLENWNLIVSSIDLNEIIFIADPKKIVLSRNFWNGIIDGLIITPISFDPKNKTHTLKIAYSGYALDRSRVSARNIIEGILISNGGTIIRESIYGQLIEVTVHSETIINSFITQLIEATHKVVFARRYSLTNALMNTVEAYMQNNNGEIMSVEASTIEQQIIDRLIQYT